MSLLCRLVHHLVAPTVHHNQGFAFSRCLRCNRDMMRSAGPVADAAVTDSGAGARWRLVPRGFRVRHDRRPARLRPHRPGRSLAGDMPRIAGAALYWFLVDALSDNRPVRPVTRRLSAQR